MELRMCHRGHYWSTGERDCPHPDCGERGAPATGTDREPDNERRARERGRRDDVEGEL